MNSKAPAGKIRTNLKQELKSAYNILNSIKCDEKLIERVLGGLNSVGQALMKKVQ